MNTSSNNNDTLCVVPPAASLEGFASLTVPVYRASTIVFPNAAAYRARAARSPDGYTYGLAGTPTTRTLESQLAEIHSAARSIIVPSGQAAITTVMLALLKRGDHVLITDNVYPPVKLFARTILHSFGVDVEYFDPTRLADLDAKIRAGATKLVWVESPGSTTMEICDIPAIAARCRKSGALLGCDNTWATGLLCKPLSLGVDIVAEAITKYAGGHSDILLGAIILDDLDLYARFRGALGALGVGTSPDDCSHALRGIQTMALRIRHAGALSEQFAQRLEASGFKVLHPCLPSFSGHALWRRDFAGCSGVFSLLLEGVDTGKVDRALDQLRTFAIGASWGGTRSIVAPMVVAGERHAMPEREDVSYIRLSIGLESAEDLWRDIERMSDVLLG
ncbi:trans-sulfuration enzyme family protein [Bradyrhizobium neotropicale]|uniref:Cystathionine beta-lyase n=1 Tax=Bradyrhizobium neotropicale TaxID=1497615 RepID=A0A176ZDY0_9BRAD|nr:PLP-dependent transferase [Bradyrhizobium neotropicale]OAF18789.1 cystathionine beta-lyase [Bradyrhizobium neotropicale]